ncbi:MAG: hypothetical protein AAGE76_11000 [Pseudomonadota bacterium]
MDWDARAREILRENDRGGYTVPTAGLYPYQWNWDSVFAALGFAAFDAPRAWEEIETLFAAQWPDGMVPHIVFRVDEPSYFPGPSVWGAEQGAWPSSGISQPPVAATAIRAMADSAPERAAALVPKLETWHRWWHRARDPQGLGVIGIVHPWESGRDNLPDWDAPGAAIDVSGVGDYTRRDTALVDADMRPKKADYDRYLALVQYGRERGWDQEAIAREGPFLVADVGITCILLRAERDLLALTERFGGDAAAVAARIAQMEAGLERLWSADAGGYCSLDMRTGRLAKVATAAAFLAFYAGVTTRRAGLLRLLEGFAEGAEYLVPSYDPRARMFDHVRYWRGPVWAVVNYMIGRGLAECGETAWAERVRRDTARLIRGAGFAEYFSPVDGQDCGGGTFSWTAAVWLAWGLAGV